MSTRFPATGGSGHGDSSGSGIFPRGLDAPQSDVERGAAHLLPALRLVAVRGREEELEAKPHLVDAALSYWEAEPHPVNRVYPLTDPESVKGHRRQRAFAGTVEEAGRAVEKRAIRDGRLGSGAILFRSSRALTSDMERCVRAVVPGVDCPTCGREQRLRNRTDLDTRLLRARRRGKDMVCLACSGDDDKEVGEPLTAIIATGDEETGEASSGSRDAEKPEGEIPETEPYPAAGNGDEEVDVGVILGLDARGGISPDAASGGPEGDGDNASDKHWSRRGRIDGYRDAALKRDAQEAAQWATQSVWRLSFAEAVSLYALLERQLPEDAGAEAPSEAPSETTPVGYGANDIAREKARGREDLPSEPLTPYHEMDELLLASLLANRVVIPASSTPDDVVDAPDRLFEGEGGDVSEEGVLPIQRRHLPEVPLTLRRVATRVDSGILDGEASPEDIERHLRERSGDRLVSAREELREIMGSSRRPGRWTRPDAMSISRYVAYHECLAYFVYRSRVRNREPAITRNLREAMREGVKHFPVSRLQQLAQKSIQDATKRNRKNGAYFIEADAKPGEVGGRLGASLKTIVEQTIEKRYWRKRFERIPDLPRSTFARLFYDEALRLAHHPELTPGYAASDPGYYLLADLEPDIDEDTGLAYNGEPENRSRGQLPGS